MTADLVTVVSHRRADGGHAVLNTLRPVVAWGDN
jgi:hypothetical protein